MNRNLPRRWNLGTLAIIAIGAMPSFSSDTVFGADMVQPPAGPHATTGHRHVPIIIEARPIVSRFKVPFVRPRRILLEPNGHLLVADWGAGTVVRIAPNGKSTIVAEDLNEPAGLARDSMGNIYVSTHAAGMTKEGKIYKIGQDGMKQVFAEGLTGPTGMAFDSQEANLYVADFHENSIVRVTLNGDVSTYVGNIPAPSDVVFDRAGNLLTCSSTDGVIYRISPMLEVTVLARGLNTPSDLTVDKKGRLVATSFGGGVLSYVSKRGKVQPIAVVPKGTIAAIFDKRGNLVIANWTDHYLMKITTHIMIPCPHCQRKIPVRLQTPRKPRPERPETMPPATPII